MLNKRSAIRYAVIVILLATAPTIASAYIDPGNGAYMVQALFTMLATVLFYLRHPVRTLKSLWRRVTGYVQSDEASKAPTSENTESAPGP